GQTRTKKVIRMHILQARACSCRPSRYCSGCYNSTSSTRRGRALCRAVGRGRSMADTTTIEFIKTVGGFAGLATAAFTIWDRWVRGRPLAWVTAERRFSGDPEDYICVKNPGYGDVFIRAVRVYPKTPKIYGVAKDQSAKAITSSFYADVNVLLPPGEQ